MFIRCFSWLFFWPINQSKDY